MKGAATSKKQAVAAVLERDGKFLLGKRAALKSSAPGYWCPITGGVESGESENAAIERELHEETGLRGTARERLASFDTRDGSTTIHWWKIESATGDARLANDEHTELGWFTVEKMRDLHPFFGEDLQFFERLGGLYEPISSFPLENGYVLKQVGLFPRHDFHLLARSVFDGEFAATRFDEMLSEHDRQSDRALASRLGKSPRIRIGAYRDDALVGWTAGWQEEGATFYMANSAILPENRRRGLYTALVRRLLELTRAQGFRKVRSRHVATHNAVLIAKLRAGFVITGFELDETYGTLVQLTYFHDSPRRRAIEFRSGLRPADAEVRRALRLDATATPHPEDSDGR